MSRAAPRPLAAALDALRERIEPATPLARVQRVWPVVAGPAMARESTPVSERGGTVTLSCRSSVWAQELDLMAPELIERLNQALEGPVVSGLRCVSTGGSPRR